MTLRTERGWTVFQRGEIREEILAAFANGLRSKLNPKTGALFTEDEIRRVTAQGSRFFVEADAIDLIGQAVQKRDEHTASQVRLDQAASPWLYLYHGVQWGETPLGATGGSGQVNARANPGVIWQGSTIAGDPFAVVGTDPAGRRFQLLLSATTPSTGQLKLTLVGLDTGTATNLPSGTVITWSNPPIGAQPTATVDIGFTGGVAKETDREFAQRVQDRIAHKPAAGNWSHFRAWARQASAAVLEAFVYCSPMHSGSVVVVPVQKRGDVAGPLAQIPSTATLVAVTSYVVPPGSSVAPGTAFVLVVPPVNQNTSGVLKLGMLKGSNSGWADRIPFPYAPDTPSQKANITAVATPTQFTLTNLRSFTFLPGQAFGATLSGANAPQMMVWNPASSSFEKLLVSSITETAPGVYTVNLTQTTTSFDMLATGNGKYVSPYTARASSIASAIVQHFDALGPGELLNIAADVRGGRAFRNPVPTERYPYRAGQGILTTLFDALGATLGDAEVSEFTVTTPLIPTNVSDGPRRLVPQHMGIYELGGP